MSCTIIVRSFDQAVRVRHNPTVIIRTCYFFMSLLIEFALEQLKAHVLLTNHRDVTINQPAPAPKITAYEYTLTHRTHSQTHELPSIVPHDTRIHTRTRHNSE